MKTIEHRLAYRHPNGDVEGFLGTGGTKKAAIADAVEQVKKKCDILADFDGNSPYDKARIVKILGDLTAAEMEAVQKDWRSGTRY